MVWQHLMRNWLRQQAAEQIQRAAVEAVRTREGDGPQAAEGAPCEPCHFGLVFASAVEAGGVVDRLEGSIKIEGEATAIQGGLSGRPCSPFR